MHLGGTVLGLVAAVMVAACGGGSSPAGAETDAGADPGSEAVQDVPGEAAGGTDVAPDVPLVAPVQADCRPNSAAFPVRPTPVELATLPFLHVEGRDIVDEAGQPVALRGINFGAWLMAEAWVSGIGVKSQQQILDEIPGKAQELGIADLVKQAQSQNKLWCSFDLKPAWTCAEEWRAWTAAHATPEQAGAVAAFWAWFDGEPWVFEERSQWKWLTKRFGYARMLELRATFLDHYITEADVERVAALGLNLIRLPVWYQALETDQEGENGFAADGWERLDRFMGWARKHGVYVIVDLHGAPGGQNPWWHQGLENPGAFWTEPACQQKAARLWKAIATYFRDEPHLAAHDLLNEPFGAPDAAGYREAHQLMYDAIRSVDTAHIVMLEDGFLIPSRLSGPKELGWQNAVMEFHDYPAGGSAEAHLAGMEKEITGLAEDWERFDCPLFYGEFSPYGPQDFGAVDDPADRWPVAAMDGVLAMMNRRGVHWAPWSWKFFAAPSVWGVYAPRDEPGRRIDVRDASFEEVKAAFEALDSANFVLDEAYGAVLRSNAGAALAPLDLAP
jgi:hypothetical protein